jgi:hypothetical protein
MMHRLSRYEAALLTKWAGIRTNLRAAQSKENTAAMVAAA